MSGPVGVLAVMQRDARDASAHRENQDELSMFNHCRGDESKEALAAVAELIYACEAVKKDPGDPDVQREFRIALARVKGESQ